MALVAVAALVVAAAYLWRFGRQDESGGGVVPFLLGGALLAVSLVHVVAWRGAQEPLLVVDLTGVRVRLGGRWTGVPWGDVASLEVANGRRFGDGKVTVRPRDERRALTDGGQRARLAVLLNRWLYDAALVVPYGLTTTESTGDVAGTLARLADGRAPVVVAEGPVAEPRPTVEVAAKAARQRDGDRDAAPEADGAKAAPRPTTGTGRAALAADRARSVGPRRLAAVVSALRAPSAWRADVTAPLSREPATEGTLALADRFEEVTEPLPEIRELRRQAPEEAEGERLSVAAAVDLVGPGHVEVDTPHRTANVELIIDATTDLSALAMRRVRQRPAVVERDYDTGGSPEPADPTSSTTSVTPPNEVIGVQVRRARDWLAMSVDDVAERTRIRASVIESIERGDFSPCGGDFYARGHLRMLSGVLGLDPAPIVSTYDEHLATEPVSPRAVFDAELSSGVLRPTGGGGSRWGALVGAVLVLLLVWGVARFFLSGPAPDPSSLTTPISQGPTTPGAGLGSPGIGDILPPPPVIPPARAKLSIATSASASASSRVVVWDRSMTIVFQGVLHAGDSKVVSGPGPLRVMAVDAGVVSLTAHGHPTAPMGASGKRAFRHVG